MGFREGKTPYRKLDNMTLKIPMLFMGCLVLLTACAKTTSYTSTKSPVRDPYAVQAIAPGDATCLKTSTAENRHGARATNAMRSRAGLPPVRANTLLAKVAAAHACDMAKRGRMTHLGTRTSGPGERVKKAGYRPMVTAENIAAGPFSQPRVLREWNISSGHRNNIMIPQVSEYGIGRAIGSDGRTRFWTAVYAAPK